MTDKLKPVRCGCGGEAKVSTWTGSNATVINDCNAVYCENCGIQTKKYNTEAEAIEAWNRAMTPHCCMTCQNWHWSKECSTNARDFCDDYEGWS